jgi:hypothetical protein
MELKGFAPNSSLFPSFMWLVLGDEHKQMQEEIQEVKVELG